MADHFELEVAETVQRFNHIHQIKLVFLRQNV